MVQPIDPRLTQDCRPSNDLPSTGPLTVADLLDRLQAAEFALLLCNNDKAEIRKSQVR